MFKSPSQSITLVLITLAIAGCATSNPRWHKLGVSPKETQTTLADCRYKVGMNKVEKSEQENVVRDCMQSQGFKWSR